MPRRVIATPAALNEPWGKQIATRLEGLGLTVEALPSNRLTGVRGSDARETYRLAKSTLALVNAPPSALRLQPIPPSADWQFHLAEGCPAHCQYCYLAGSLSGPPVVRVFANLPTILGNLAQYERPDTMTSFEASCYTDPLGFEHLTGSLAETIRYFGTRPDAHLRWTSKFDAVDDLLDLPHNGRTRCRLSLNADPVARRFEGGVASLENRIAALRKLAKAGYPVGVTLAPILPIDDWERHYAALLEDIAAALDFPCDLTFELITHRFTPGSRDVLLNWYPKTTLPLDPSERAEKRTKFGGVKYVLPPETMRSLRRFFEREIAARFPHSPILYWT